MDINIRARFDIRVISRIRIWSLGPDYLFSDQVCLPEARSIMARAVALVVDQIPAQLRAADLMSRGAAGERP